MRIAALRKFGAIAAWLALSGCAAAPPPVACNCPAPERKPCPEFAPVESAPRPGTETATPSSQTSSSQKVVELGDKLLLGSVEFVDIQPGGLHLEARIDSGAKTSSLHAQQIVRFERDGRRWVRFRTFTGRGAQTIQLELPWVRRARIKGEGEAYEARPVVLVDVRIGTRTQGLEMTLTDRRNYDYPVLIGRNFLRDHALIDTSRSHLQGK